MYISRYFILFIVILFAHTVYGQQDMGLNLTGTFLSGKNILKVKRDFHDPYLWVLAQNNEIYRVNSITKVVDDYTAQFSAYSGYQFIDIAGRSQDTVFVATNSTNVIEYKKGQYKVIGTADGIAGTVNSIGIDYTGTSNGLTNSNYIVFIATSNGMNRYDCQKETMLPSLQYGAARVFEATYRSEMLYGADYCRCYPDTVIHHAATELVDYTIYTGELWLGGNSFGNSLKTAFYFGGNAYHPGNQFVVYANQFWATENGLFQNFWNYSYTTQPLFYPYYHYLKGLNITKITSIFGLLGFGSDIYQGLVRENILVGTSQGLYFSNSKYQKNASYTFYHDPTMGTKAINDLCVNATSYASTDMTKVCENGIWVAATDGLYLLAPDYASYINPAQILQAIQFNGQLNTVSQLQICANSTVSAVISSFQYSANVQQWYKDGQTISGQTGTSLTISAPGDYYAILYDPCSPLYFESNHLKVSVISAPVFSFNYPDTVNYCYGSTAALKTDNNASYQYRWYQNDVLNGNTTTTLNTTTPGKYKVEVSACQGNSWTSSKEVQINFVKMPVPIITTDKAAYCSGDQATLTANVPINASQIVNWSPYQYRWYKDGALNNSVTASITVSQPGKYRVEVLSCTGTWIASADTVLKFITISLPNIVADKAAYCIGDQASLSINFANDGTYSINWFKDGIVLSADLNKTLISTNQPGAYTVTIGSNLTTCSATSSGYTLLFDGPPDISIKQTITTSLCMGQTVKLSAIYPMGGNIKWSTGETNNIIAVGQSGTYSATVTTASGCTATQSTTVQFFSNPVLALADASLCQYTNEKITLTAPSGFVKYDWNVVTGSQSYNTGNIGKVTLTVTDNNGCQGTQVITVNSICKDIHIPNVITPNGDGLNDAWDITGLENDNSTTVKVYNRFGTLVFEEQGYAKPWDGIYQGKRLPIGAYYYIISARGAKQILSGSVTIIY